MPAEGAKVLLDRLLIPDVGQDIVKTTDGRAVRGHRLEHHRFAARIRAGNDEHAFAGRRLKLQRHEVASALLLPEVTVQQRVSRGHQTQRPAQRGKAAVILHSPDAHRTRRVVPREQSRIPQQV